MDLNAATATAGNPLGGVLIVALAATLAVGVYALLCTFAPFRTCRRCAGLGARRGGLTRTLKPCHRCRATGRRLRYGRRAFNYLARIRHDGTRAERRAAATTR